MPPPAGTLRVGRYFLALFAILAVLYGLVFLPGSGHTPKLGLDLVGGKEVVFTAKTDNGQHPSSSSMSQARQIIEDRVDGSGVSNATVVVQGGNQIVVSVPGQNNTDIASLGKPAQLNLRPLIMPAVPLASASAGTTTTPAPTTSPTASPTGAASASGTATPTSAPTAPSSAPASAPSSAAASAAASPNAANERALNAPASSTPAKPSTTPKASTTPAAGTSTAPAAATPTPTSTAAASTIPTKPTATPFKGMSFGLPNSESSFNQLTQEQQAELQQRLSMLDCTKDQPDGQAQQTQPLLACDTNDAQATTAFLLGPVIVPGTQISTASAVPPDLSGSGGGSTQWTVSLNFKSKGSAAWAKYTGAHNTNDQTPSDSVSTCGTIGESNGGSGTPCADFVAFTLDGAVINAPYNMNAINGGATQIQGGFTEDTANTLARQLKYGALPLNFTAQNSEDVSATLGTAQLKAGLLAGGIGLILVVIYSLLYYRALGFITIASLIISGVLTYASLVILGREMGLTLSLAGIAGFIVAVGITADSSVVFFERLKDEVREGRSARGAVPRAWVRARRTILSADTVSFLAAAVLYYFAAGDVKGFAFTLGLSTIVNLVVVFLFTHPLVSLLSRGRRFGSSRLTGLDAQRAQPAVAVAEAEAPATRPARPARATRRGATSAEPAPAAVAVLDPEDEPVDADLDPEPPPDEAPDADASPAPERPRTSPKAGSAAERAAARRAKLRAEAGDSQKGER